MTRCDILCLATFFIVTLAAHYHSLYHAPRADHLTYLYCTAGKSDILSLTIGAYSFVRSEWRGDSVLFRPITYLLLGLERWAFGYRFMLWQATSLSLHLCVVYLLYRVLRWREGSSVFLAFLFSAFFAVQYISMEEVIWHNLSGYTLFCIFLLGAIYALQKYAAESAASRWVLVSCLLVGAFTYELGVAAPLLFGAYLAVSKVIDKRRSASTTARRTMERHTGYTWGTISACVAIPFTYIIVSLLDLYARFGHISAWRQMSSAPLPTTLGRLCLAAGMWLGGALVPTLFYIAPGSRLRIMAITSPFSGRTAAGIGLASVIIVTYGVLMLRRLNRKSIQDNLGFVLLMAGLMFSFAAAFVFGRKFIRVPFTLALFTSTYRAYFFNLVAVIFFHTMISPAWAGHGSKTLLFAKAAFAGSLVVVTLISGMMVYTMNAKMREWSEPRVRLVKSALELIERHGDENDFSFSVAPDCPYDAELPWFPTTARSACVGKVYTYMSVLFPQAYRRTGGKYLLPCGHNVP